MTEESGADTSTEPREFGVELESNGEGTVLHVRGEVDLYTAPKLRERLDDVVATGQRTVVDLAELDFIDSTGLGVLVGALKQAREADGDVVLRNASRSTHKILEIAGLTKLFTIE